MATTALRTPSPPPAALWLGGSGLLPFAGLALATWLLPEARVPAAVHAVVAYGAVILSFVGGAHWGFGSKGPGSAALLAASVVPSLLGWVALLLPPVPGLLLLAAGFAAVLLVDREAVSAALAPPWWMRLRLPLSLTVAALLLLAVAGVLLR
ncbi:MAG: DUF3429 domain-containing protein [Geminicoccaceae bacterium]